MTNHTDSSHISDSASGGKGESMAREGRENELRERARHFTVETLAEAGYILGSAAQEIVTGLVFRELQEVSRISHAPAQGSEARPGVGTAVESDTADEKGLASRVEELERELAKRFDAHEWEGYRDVAICLVLGYCGFQQCQCDLPNIWERNGDKAYEMAERALAGKKGE